MLYIYGWDTQSWWLTMRDYTLFLLFIFLVCFRVRETGVAHVWHKSNHSIWYESVSEEFANCTTQWQGVVKSRFKCWYSIFMTPSWSKTSCVVLIHFHPASGLVIGQQVQFEFVDRKKFQSDSSFVLCILFIMKGNPTIDGIKSRQTNGNNTYTTSESGQW